MHVVTLRFQSIVMFPISKVEFIDSWAPAKFLEGGKPKGPWHRENSSRKTPTCTKIPLKREKRSKKAPHCRKEPAQKVPST